MADLHVAIVLDGNRRYGKRIGNRLKGHEEGAQKVEDAISWCDELGVKELTLYTFSTENFNRGSDEVNYLMGLFRKQFGRLRKDKKVKEKRMRVDFIGRLELFDDELQRQMKELSTETEGNKGLKVNFAVGYGGRAEIVDAMKRLIAKGLKPSDIDETTISENLYIGSDVDIFIRPGGEKRLSNFLLWQASYAELFFLDKMWPEFTKNDFVKIIEEFNLRERRFGE